MSDLKPCPLCEGEFTYSQEPQDNHPVGGMYYFFHKSGSKGCGLHFGGHFDDLEPAIAAWNTCTDLTPQWRDIATITPDAGHVLYFGNSRHDSNVAFTGWIGANGMMYSDADLLGCRPTHWQPITPPE